MKVKKLKFKDFFIIKPKVHSDRRGVFRRHICQRILKKNNINLEICQGNVSESYKKGTLRGFHFKKNHLKNIKFYHV